LVLANNWTGFYSYTGLASQKLASFLERKGIGQLFTGIFVQRNISCGERGDDVLQLLESLACFLFIFVQKQKSGFVKGSTDERT